MTITKERVAQFIKNPLDNGLTRGEQMELARIALASIEAEPVHQFWNVKAHEWVGCDKETYDSWSYLPGQRRVLYTAPPAPENIKE